MAIYNDLRRDAVLAEQAVVRDLRLIAVVEA
jgi:hypothetical protein